ncbi:helix-turn-helix transcriptional regulator [Hoeflea prorocentri]|uniref:Helix-turn-helix transcriptional regulator n=1 Tax=Hoeflea prorocentri TaxID=1922333 RepID=A0A9X3UJT0_9HYPH|nr:helix-turn-helix transcriptional regulator [Hoeflea prorocentri]MCY6380091.1 helix-turn-helix transcriptional regulator [Hoeflea prorocentri]MDA5397891.1 helix-turn-helix transcriptional regulator [Hoeflea prorocentri]
MTANSKNEDFASATMIRLVAAGLAQQGIPVPVRPPTGARVSRTAKRELLEAVMAEHGRIAVLTIADAARDMPPEPVAQALLKARSISDLLDRWRRLEKFSHGRHEIQVENQGQTTFGLRHRARDGHAPPTEVETLLVMAVLTVLCEIVTSAPVDLCASEGKVLRNAGIWHDPGAVGAHQQIVLSGAPFDGQSAMAPEAPHEGLVENLRHRVASDPLRRWTLTDLCAEAGASRRTLQRRLTENSTSFSRLIAEARLQTAARYLCNEPARELAEIGFLSGYCDQAHFTRSFTRLVGTTPRAYRADFGR